MLITDEVWEKWSPAMTWGDAIRIHDSITTEPKPVANTIRTALAKRKCSEEVFEHIANYYNAKLKKMQEVVDGE